MRFAEALGLGVAIATLLLIGDLLFLRFGLAGVLLTEVLVVAAPAALYAFLAGLDLGQAFRLRLASPRAVTAALLLSPFLCLAASAFLQLELEVVPLPGEEIEAWNGLASSARSRPWLALLALVVAPALCEEALFRGVLLTGLERRLGRRQALCLSAALFAVFHRSLHRLLPQALLGVALGALVQRSGSLLPAVSLHFAYNLGILLLGDRLSALAFEPLPVATSALLAALAFLLLGRERGTPARLAPLLLILALHAGCSVPVVRDPGTVVVALETAPANLDPRWGVDGVSQNLHQLLHASLLRIGPTGEPENDLATSVEWLDDLTWRVGVRQDAYFHDGRRLTARDVSATFDGLIRGTVPSPRRGAYTRLERVEASDEATVLFRTCEPFPSLPVNLVMGIVPEGSAANLGSSPIGAGPFRLGVGDGLTRIVLERHPLHHGLKAASERMVFRVLPDATTRALELRKGSLDLVLNSLPLDMIEPLSKLPTLRIDSAPGTAYWYLGFNFQDPVLARHEVREAIARAIDRDALVRSLLRGYASKASGPLAPGNPYFVEDLPAFERDRDRARALLDQAGFKDPDGDGPAPRFKLVLRTSTNETARLQALAISDMLREVGIDLEVRSYEFATFFEDVRAGRFQVFTLRWVGVTDPDWFGTTFHSRAVPPKGQNRGRYANPEVDRLLEAAEREMDPLRRHRIYAEAQRRIAADLPYVSLFHSANVAVRSAELHGLELYAGGEYTPLARVSREAPGEP